MDFNRYAYARGNPMKYNDPSGHCIWDLCLIEGIGLVELLAAAGGTAAYYSYVNSPAGQAAIEHAAQALDNLNGQPAQEAVPLPAPAKPQLTGTPLNADDTTIQASTPLGDSVTAPLLSDPLPSSQKGSNIVYAKRSVSLQTMSGAISDSAEKGFHINTDVQAAELGLEPGPKNSILIRAVGSVKVNPNDYVNEVNKLLNTQTDKVLVQLNGIISANKPNSLAATQAQQLIATIKSGKYTVRTK